ncbi:hypothetical protein [Streptomyces marianii]|uniref:Uncharacterized protein n=1 Tax=Streptomyces marianii TaxID=1817406 RepID=A0A5R9DT27_9ACTN|nr:hypothetical protein [Streptomyces marianii]TLQ39285.1 hypothetical protein FEF34_38480 [Streptomyces marianii]
MRILTRARDRAVRALIHIADHAARRSDVPNPMAATRVVLLHLADQNLSGADVYEEITSHLSTLGFTWPDGLCDRCDGPITADQRESSGLCADCTWVCACAYENSLSQEECDGCHLTRSGQGEPMPPCTCGCDPTPGEYGDYDTESSVSRQHRIDTGRFLRPGESLAG